MSGLKKYWGSLLAISLLLSSRGWAQEKDTLLIHFDFARSRLRPADKAAINSSLSLYTPSARLTGIALYGHCDNIGGNEYNDRLSRARIRGVRDYLRSRSLLRSPSLSDSLFRRMNGYGKRRPLNDNGDDIKRSLNRRVEIVFYTVPGQPATPNSAGPVNSSFIPAPVYPVDSTPSLTLSEFFRDSAGIGKTFILRNLNFIAGRHVLMPYSDTILKELLQIMLDSPRLKIEILGHVCCIPEDLDGLDFDSNTNDLSVRRARFVYEYLRQWGVKASRMSYHGFGASRKLYPMERSDYEQELNRRVEIKVISR